MQLFSQMVIEVKYDYDIEIRSGSRMAVFQSLKDGNIDVEPWVNNMIEVFEEGWLNSLSVNSDNGKGRGIEPMAPDLGRLIGSPAGRVTDEI